MALISRAADRFIFSIAACAFVYGLVMANAAFAYPVSMERELRHNGLYAPPGTSGEHGRGGTDSDSSAADYAFRDNSFYHPPHDSSPPNDTNSGGGLR